MNPRKLLLSLPVAVTIATALLATDAHAIFSVTEPWVRASPDGRNAEFFVKLRSSEAVTLVGVDSFAAKSTTLHAAGSPAPVKSIALPANTVVELKPQEARIRLSGLVRKLKFGEYVPLTLFVRGGDGNEQKVFVNAEVRHRSPTEDELDPRGHQHGSHKH